MYVWLSSLTACVFRFFHVFSTASSLSVSHNVYLHVQTSCCCEPESIRMFWSILTAELPALMCGLLQEICWVKRSLFQLNPTDAAWKNKACYIWNFAEIKLDLLKWINTVNKHSVWLQWTTSPPCKQRRKSSPHLSQRQYWCSLGVELLLLSVKLCHFRLSGHCEYPTLDKEKMMAQWIEGYFVTAVNIL